MTALLTEDEKQISKKIEFISPQSIDGYEVNQLVKNCKPLDENSIYCNLLQCYHFSETSICAKANGVICGFVSGYILPGKNNTLFIWQVAVSEHVRGQGLGMKMINKILSSEACKNVKFIQTTVTKSNHASWRLFQKLANILSVEHNSNVLFNDITHFRGEHESEELITLGPIE